MAPPRCTAPPPPPPPIARETVKAATHKGRLLHRSLANPPHMVASALGSTLHLANGRTVIDACGGAAVAIIGHGNQEVLDAVVAQAQKVSYVHTQSYSTPVAEELADLVLDGKPHGLEKALFLGSGSEVTEAALKLARQYHFERNEARRVHLVSRKQSYHGNTMASMSVSHNLARKRPYEGFEYPHVSHVTPPYAYRYKLDGETDGQFTARLLRELEGEFLRVGPETVVAFICEPIIGATAGCVVPPAGYLAGVRSICDKYGILLILDEVMCGTGRTGTFFAFEQEHVVPDIVTVAKGLGGGYAAIAALYVHGRIIDTLRQGSQAVIHGHTYQAHPVSCAAALAVQKILKRGGLVERCRDMGVVLERLLRRELAECRSVGDIRGRGLFWAVEFVKDAVTKECFDPLIGFGAKVTQICLEKGVAVYPGSGTVDGLKGDHVLLAPPYTVTEEELVTVCRTLRESILSQEARYLYARANSSSP
ncbi:Aminotransferase class-III [Metarhizium album ARSEF 1941]|uniref:Aminotransferase class-III n=1 Tax=Metarhizium album (strain ARSEF 1941) TaxID=1081103 RepID=A0A0B2WFJ2_METAS|nr:Aminotransferase class-III [Metarhizium album ARSEF 1941]KHN94701.1 Aminotransferase class-III [Metarhizium album ARSEF 1941]